MRYSPHVPLSPSRFVVVAIVLLCGACGHARKVHQRSASDLTESARLYNDYVRWGNLDRAAQFVDPADRTAFLAAQAKKADVRYTEFRIGPVDFPPESTEATVRIIRSFYRQSDLTEASESVLQHWVRKGDHWYVKPEDVSDVTVLPSH